MATNVSRQNRSFLAQSEQALIRYLLPRIPQNVTSLHLSALGFAGSIMGSLGLIGCNFSLWCLIPVVAGIAINWFGDSLDGSLARYRQNERPRFGFLIDHTLDLFSQIALIVAFGLSPFLSLIAALVILLLYTLYSAYTYIRAAAHHVHQMAYIGLGATEFRILMVVYAIGAAVAGIHEPLHAGFSRLDLTIFILAGFAVIGLGVKAVQDARCVAEEEGVTLAPDRQDASRVRPDETPAAR